MRDEDFRAWWDEQGYERTVYADWHAYVLARDAWNEATKRARAIAEASKAGDDVTSHH